MELKDLIQTFKLSETDLLGIKDRLKKKAASSARKNDDGPHFSLIIALLSHERFGGQIFQNADFEKEERKNC